MEIELKNKEIALEFSFPFSPFEGKRVFALLESEKNLPLLDLKEKGSGVFSFHLLTPFRDYGGEFFYEMIYRWLFPTERPFLIHFFQKSFYFPKKKDILLKAELCLRFSLTIETEMILKNFEMLKQEISLGLFSRYYAEQILEMKGLSIEEKRGAIQRRLVEKLKRFPSLFDEEIFFLMQRLFLAKGLSFKRDRKAKQISEILSFLYLLEKKVERKVEEEPYRRHLFIKLLSRQITLPLGSKKVLAVFVGMNLLKEHELFSKDSLLQGIKSSFPKVHFVEGSDFLFVDEEKKIRLLYLEVGREENRNFSLPELRRLKEKLPLSLKRRITQLLPPLFMPRNEEELLRHLITLSRELKFAKTVPQVILSFDKETDQDLFFTVILARLVFPKSPSIEELLGKVSFSLSPTLERSKILGTLRKKYFKEGVIFKVRLSLTQFIREDSAVDLYAARHYLLSEIEKGFGKIRDFNGGLISKQTEVLKELKKLFRGLKKEEILLLDTFFHALFPIEKRGLIELSKLKKFFLLFLKQVRVEEEKGKLREIGWEEDLGSLYILIDSVKLSLERKMKEVLSAGQLHFSFQIDERLFMGAMFSLEEISGREAVLTKIRELY